ncbi:MAG: S-layer homology domain-containing protein [Clostridia bacterium]
MLRRILLFCLLLALLVPGVAGATSAPAVVFKDIQNHWAKDYIQEMSALGIYQGYKPEFKPDQPITRGEALVLLNRLYKVVYGTMADPATTTRLDAKHWATAEIKSLIGNLNQLFYTDMRSYTKFNPGENMLYYLQLAGSGKKMKYVEYASDKWFIPGAYLDAQLSREEASMIFFHVLAPYFRNQLQATTLDVEQRFTSYYSWKQPTNYLDNPSPYATALQGFPLYTPGEKEFLPKKKVTRAEFAVNLKRLYDGTTRKLNEMLPVNKMNIMLSAASFAYQKQNAAEMDRYFSAKAKEQLVEAAAKAGTKTVPLHHYSGIMNIDNPMPQELNITASYKDSKVGSYEVTYYFKLDDTKKNSYGWVISAINYAAK